MKSLSLSRHAVSVCVTAALLAGCSQTESTPLQPILGSPPIRMGQPRLELAQSSGGGAFSAGYSGTYKWIGCVPGYGGRDGQFSFSGAGTASFLHGSKESGALTRGHFYRACFEWEGHAKMISSKNPLNAIYIDVNLRNDSSSPCVHSFSYTVIGGRGKFAKASGSGKVTFQCSGSAYTDQWSGSLNF